jgi:polyphosphate:AMP phosphotransferase
MPEDAAPTVGKKEYKRRSEGLRARLVEAQVALKQSPLSLVVVIAGVDAAGKGDAIRLLNEWLDPRGVETVAFNTPSDEERERPPFWRYWRFLPARGQIAIFTGAWNASALAEEAFGKHRPARFQRAMERIAAFEQMLVADGTVLVKLWLHLGRKEQRRRLLQLERDPRTAWRVTSEDWQHHALYERYDELARDLRRHTHRPGAEWTVIDCADERARNLAIGRELLDRLGRRLRQANRPARPSPPPPAVPTPVAPQGRRLLAEQPLDAKLGPRDYRKARDRWLPELNRLVWEIEKARRSVVFVFEGWDAAGKGGTIRRLVSAIDPRYYRVIPIAKPTEDEKRRHYLSRFWVPLPRAGHVTIYDRSWYGRVLVERVEGFCTRGEWQRAFAEIVEFERQLVEHGIVVLKFWLHISKEEQLQRFRAREATPHKRHKIDPEDWRNRGKWEAYEVCVGDMVALTSSEFAPWHIVAANDKRHARIQVLKTTCEALAAALEP